MSDTGRSAVRWRHASPPSWKASPSCVWCLEEEVTPESLRRVASHELAAAVVMESPAAAQRHGVRIDTLHDEPLLVALAASHQYAAAPAMPVSAFVSECVLLPREPPGQMFNSWFKTVIRAAGYELGMVMQTMSAPWDRRMLPVANGEAVCPFVAEWTADADGVVAVLFDPPLSFPTDLGDSLATDERSGSFDRHDPSCARMRGPVDPTSGADRAARRLSPSRSRSVPRSDLLDRGVVVIPSLMSTEKRRPCGNQ